MYPHENAVWMCGVCVVVCVCVRLRARVRVRVYMWACGFIATWMRELVLHGLHGGRGSGGGGGERGGGGGVVPIIY